MAALDRRNLIGNSPAINPIKKQNQQTTLEDMMEGFAAPPAPTVREARGGKAAPQQRTLTVTPESEGEHGCSLLSVLRFSCLFSWPSEATQIQTTARSKAKACVMTYQPSAECH